jgi:hypothetical protein
LDGIAIFCRDAEKLMHMGAAEFEHPTAVWDNGWKFVNFNRQSGKYETQWSYKGFNVRTVVADGEISGKFTDYYTQVTVVAETETLFRLFAFRPARTVDQSKNTPTTGPQNPATGEDIQPRNLLANIFHLLDDNRCSTFVSNLINVARQLTGKKPYTYDGKELAVAIASQENGGFLFRSGANGGGGAGSAYGDIFSGQATTEIVMFNTSYGPRNPVGVQVSYALTALHEILHLAGGGASPYDGSRAYYMDMVRARAAQILTGAPGYAGAYDPNTPWTQIRAEMTKAAGTYWDTQLREHCTPQEYR